MKAATIPRRIEAGDDAARAESLRVEPLSPEAIVATAPKTTPVQNVTIVLGTIAFLYFARPVVLPVFMACFAAMTLKPISSW